MERRICILCFLLLVCGLTAQEARVKSFNHTVRWLDEYNFPNYFLDPDVYDSVCADIRYDLMLRFQVANVVFPSGVKYRMITGFGKPKDDLSKESKTSGYVIDIFSFLTRGNMGLRVFWSVKVVVRKDGVALSQKEVTKEIESVNAAVYMDPQRWWAAGEFQRIFTGLARESLGTGEPTAGKVVIGHIGAKEEEVRAWFPDMMQYRLITRGNMQADNNFSAQLVNGPDTLVRFILKNKADKSVKPFSLKPLMADLFSELTGWGLMYTTKVKQRRRAMMEPSAGEPILLQMDWIEEYTRSSMDEEVEYSIVVPMIGAFFEDTVMSGKFVYQTKAEVDRLPTAYPFRSAVIHEVTGVFHGRSFMAEYDEFFGMVQIAMDGEVLAAMILQNVNPDNLNAFMNRRLSKNKITVTGGPGLGVPDLEEVTKQEWYSFFIKKGSSAEDQMHSIDFLVCLFFCVGLQ